MPTARSRAVKTISLLPNRPHSFLLHLGVSTSCHASIFRLKVPKAGKLLLADPGSQCNGYSAKALAYSWEAANGQLPREVKTLFGDDAELIIALPEHKVSLGDRGRDSQTDVFAIIKREGRNHSAVAVEGKVAEFFGPTIKGWYVEPIAEKEKRLGCTCAGF